MFPLQRFMPQYFFRGQTYIKNGDLYASQMKTKTKKVLQTCFINN